MTRSRWLSIAELTRKLARTAAPKPLFQLGAEWYNFIIGTRRIGWESYAQLRNFFPDRTPRNSNPVPVQLCGLDHPFFVRPGTPDAIEVVHTIVRESYGKLLPPQPVQLIIDAGAYIGDSTSWYLSRFPTAKVIALEPHPESYKMLELNCSPYGKRADLINGALWPRRTSLQIHQGSDGTTDVFVGEGNEQRDSRCEGFSPVDLLARSGLDQIDIFKCDIEGAETQLFSADCENWITRTRALYIDVHSSDARTLIGAVANHFGFRRQDWRELVVLYR